MRLVAADSDKRFTDLGVFIRGLRDAKGWTQKELAARAKMRNERVSEIENGSNARIDKFEKIAHALGYRGGVLEMIMSGGDVLTTKMLRLWRRLPDEGARKDVLKSMRDQIVADTERDAT